MAAEPWTIGRLLEWMTQYFTEHQVDAPRVSAERLLAHVLGCQRIELYTRIAREPSAVQRATLRELVRRRAAHEPLEYLTGRAAFMALEFVVDPRVLIPRPETEMLVELTLDAVKATRRQASLFEAEPSTQTAQEEQPPEPEPRGPLVMDLCTGSGCVGLSVAHYLRDAEVYACDCSAAALEVAAENRRRLKLEDRVHLRAGDLFAAFLDEQGAAPSWRGRVDFILANPPYVERRQVPQLEPPVRDYEPHAALDGGQDGLEVHRRIVAEAPRWLAAGGRLLVETAFDQSQRVAALFEQTGRLEDVRIVRDPQGHGRVVLARRPEPAP
jgi:release factor glutamine methyltransferase